MKDLKGKLPVHPKRMEVKTGWFPAEPGPFCAFFFHLADTKNIAKAAEVGMLTLSLL